MKALRSKKISRKTFLKICLSGLAVIASGTSIFKSLFAAGLAEQAPFNGRIKKNIVTDYDLVAVKGEDPYAMTVKAVQSMGGMGRFVGKNSVVVIKPNIGWDRTPGQAANTNPQVVAALVDMAFEAGAKRVNIFDITCNDPQRCYSNSGVENTAKGKGAHVYFPDEWNTVKAHFAYASPMEGWPILKDALECDTFINVPVLKHHGLTRLTLSMKNLMGVCGGNRGIIHQDIGRKLVDLTTFINPDLTVIDAFKVLVRNGPTGGDLKDVVDMKTVLAATDPTLADAYACTLADVDPMDVSYVRNAIERNIGKSDIKSARVAEFTV